MNQQETINALKENPTQAKQLNVMMETANDAFRSNMSSFSKMVQMDAIRTFNEHCDKDGVGGGRVRFLYDTMDPIMGQINNELNSQIMERFNGIKASLGPSGAESTVEAQNEAQRKAEPESNAGAQPESRADAQHEAQHNAQPESSGQQKVIEALKEDPRKAKQVSALLGIISEAFENNMAAYIRLVHFDVMSDFDARCDKDGVGGERVRFSHGAMDPMMKQVNEDLKKQITSQFAKVKESLASE